MSFANTLTPSAIEVEVNRFRRKKAQVALACSAAKTQPEYPPNIA